MIPIAQATIVLAAIGVLLWRRVPIGKALLLSSILLALLPGHPATSFPRLCRGLFLDLKFYWVLAIVIGVSLLGTILKQLDKIPLLVSSLESIIGNRSLVLPLLPSVIASLPMPGGAYLSAPMVDQAAGDSSFSPEKRAVLNHWFRHQLEFLFPLYPGFILAGALSDIPLRILALHTAPLALVGWISGYLLLLRGEELGRMTVKRSHPWRDLASAVWPVALVVTGTFLGLPFLGALFLSIAALAVTHRLYDLSRWKRRLSNAAGTGTVLMITGVFAFKHGLEVSGLAATLAPALRQAGLHPVFIMFVVPALTGLLVGYAAGYVGITFPVLLPLISNGSGADPSGVMWIYACGWAGMMLSPAHLCLVLTLDYFKADSTGTFSRLCLLCVITVLAAFLLYVSH